MSQLSTSRKKRRKRGGAGFFRSILSPDSTREKRDDAMHHPFQKRRTLWLGFVAVLVPLLILLVLQFVWLGHLRRVTAIAHQAALHTFLESVGTDIQYFYRSEAERALNISASAITQNRIDLVAQQWKVKPVAGARRLFLVDFTREQFGNFYVYNAATHELETPAASEESMAIILASTPWQVMRFRTPATQASSLMVDERSPQYRIIMNPIVDEWSKVVGVAGMILDEDFFTKELLPSVLKKALPKFFPEASPEYVSVTVRSPSGAAVYASGDLEGKTESVTRAVPFVFTDWTFVLNSAGNMPERLASSGFAFNLTLTALLGLVLMGGIAVALRGANRAMKLSEMKSDFVSNVSHELRTPLASIRVFAELLRLGRVRSQEKVQEYGEFIEAESRRLTGLINNILDFARIESGRRTYRFSPGDIEEVVKAVLKSFEIRLAPAGFRIAFHGPREPLPPVEMDSDAIGQALHNLLDNAVKYSGDARDIEVRLDRDGDFAVISVRDRGIGIARGEQRKIFERFHRVSTGLVHDVKGSGLGLSIVHHIVQAHRGRVAVESDPGAGSEFSVYLPVRRREAPGPTESGARDAPTEAGAPAREHV
jgi:signal transduction histidine kinase